MDAHGETFENSDNQNEENKKKVNCSLITEITTVIALDCTFPVCFTFIPFSFYAVVFMKIGSCCNNVL